MSDEKDLKRKLNRRKGFSASNSNSRRIPMNLIRQANSIAERESERQRKRDRRERKEEDPDGDVVMSVPERRVWLHELRMEAGQDPALNDYTVIDRDLQLDWEYLLSGEE